MGERGGLSDALNNRRCLMAPLCIALIIIGLACVGLGAAMIGLDKAKYSYWYYGNVAISHGIWGGFFFILTGSVGFAAARGTSGCSVIAFMVLCLVSAMASAVVLGFSVVGCLVSKDAVDYEKSYANSNYATSYSHRYMFGLNIALAIISSIGGVISTVGSILCCAVLGSLWDR